MGIFDFFNKKKGEEKKKEEDLNYKDNKPECNEMLNDVEEEEQGNIILDEIITIGKVNEMFKEVEKEKKRKQEEEKRKRMKPLDEILPVLWGIIEQRAGRMVRKAIELNEKEENRTEEEVQLAANRHRRVHNEVKQWWGDRITNKDIFLTKKEQDYINNNIGYDPILNSVYLLNKFLFENGEKEKKVNILKIHYCKTLFNDIVKAKGILIENDEVADMYFEDFELKILQDLKKYEKKLKKTHSTKGMELPIFLIREIWKNETLK